MQDSAIVTMEGE